MGVRRSQVPPHLYERYGIPERPPRAGLIALSALLVGALGLFGFLLSNQGPGEQVRLVSWQPVTGGAEVTWYVLRYDNQPVYCVLRAQNERRYDVAFAVVRVKGTENGTVFTHTLNARGEVFTVDTPACVLEPERLIRPNFRPGLLAPAQETPLFAPWQPVAAWLQG